MFSPAVDCPNIDNSHKYHYGIIARRQYALHTHTVKKYKDKKKSMEWKKMEVMK